MNEPEYLENEEIKYPAETHKLMSWAALRFIHRPPHRLASLVAASILALITILVVMSFVIKVDHRIEAIGLVQSDKGLAEIYTASPGLMLAQLKSPGSRVHKDETIALVQSENSPLQQEIKSSLDGQLLHYSVEKGVRLGHAQVVALILPKDSILIGSLEVSQEEASQITIGQSVDYELEGHSAKMFGHLKGKVTAVNLTLPHGGDKMEKLHYIVKATLAGQTEALVAGEHLQLLPGTELHARILIRRRRIISSLIESFFHSR